MTIDPDLARLAKLRNLAAAAHVLGHDEVDIGTSDLFMLLDAAEELQRAHEAHAELVDEEARLRERVAELETALRPFVAAFYAGDLPDGFQLAYRGFVTARDYRRGEAVLEKGRKK